MYVARSASPKILLTRLLAAPLALVALTVTVRAQAPVMSSFEEPVHYIAIEQSRVASHPGAEPHDFGWTWHFKRGDFSVSDSSLFVLGTWFSERSVSYDVEFLSFGVDTSNRSILGKKHWSSANVSLDFTSLPIVGDDVSVIFDSLSIDRSYELSGRARRRCSSSSVSWQTREVKWRSMHLSIEGSFDAHTKEVGAWVRVVVVRHSR